jgi:hypothetical protein
MAYQHIENVAAEALFSDCGHYRYRLTLRHGTRTGGKTVCVIMQNPSVASHLVADKSVQFLEKIIFTHNLPLFEKVSQIIIVNQFARIQTKNFQGRKADIGPGNDAQIRDAIGQSDTILIAWGKTNPYKDRQDAILEILREFPDKQVLMTKKHPSRGSYDDFIIPYSV